MNAHRALTSLLLALAALQSLSACDSSAGNARKPPGARCLDNAECLGICADLGEGADPAGKTLKRCVDTCETPGEPCENGGLCTPLPDRDVNACPLTFCADDNACGLNATCTGAASDAVCTCIEHFYGDARTACSLCTPENQRPGCELNTQDRPAVPGQCLPLAGGESAGPCSAQEDCPNNSFGCFGYLPPQTQDPPCTCADLRGKDLSQADALDDLQGAFYDPQTLFPEGFDPTTSGAFGPGAQLQGADLAGEDLQGADLQGANLEGANLEGANLEGANLQDANLEGANLQDANLQDANLAKANLEGANLQGANLQDANLALANLSGVSLDGASGLNPRDNNLPPWLRAGLDESGSYDPQRAADAIADGTLDPASDLQGANLQGADLTAAPSLQDANLQGANLQDANLQGRDLSGVNLDDANLQNANLDDAFADPLQPPSFKNARLDGASLRRANLPHTDFTGASLVMANLEDANLEGAILLGATDAQGNVGPLDMTGANLRGTRLDHANLEGALLRNISTNPNTRFNDANLKRATLDDSDLRGASFDNANLEAASLQRVLMSAQTSLDSANLKATNFTQACLPETPLHDQDLQGASFDGANLVGADLQRANFTNVSMRGALLGTTPLLCACYPEGGPLRCLTTQLRGANLQGADLSPWNEQPADLNGLDLRGLVMEGADLRRALLDLTDMRTTNLTRARLSESTNLRTALLSEAILQGADLRSADLHANEIRNAKLRGADLSLARLTQTQLDGADLQGAILHDTQTDRRTSLRQANLDLTSITGCLQANLSDASMKQATLTHAALIAPSGLLFDPEADFNCRINFEGALLPRDTQRTCGQAFPDAWLLEGRNSTDSVFLQSTLIKKLKSDTDLRCAYLQNANLQGRSLPQVRLDGANLQDALLGRNPLGTPANLEGASLRRALLQRADLSWANLRDANLQSADLRNLNLRDADLRKANLSGALINDSTQLELAKYSCTEAERRLNPEQCTRFPNYDTFRFRQLKMIGPESDLAGVDLGSYPGLTNPPVDLSFANLKGAIFTRTQLTNVNFNGANLEDANLLAANLSGARLTRTNAKKANFSGASISAQTTFSGSNLIEANFVGANGTPNVSGALCSEDTSFDSASIAFVFVLDISIEQSGILFFPVITLELVPGWNVGGACCFPLSGGVRIGC